jgi:hypothetical protein
LLATGSITGEVVVWNWPLDELQSHKEFQCHTDRVVGIAFSPDRRYI